MGKRGIRPSALPASPKLKFSFKHLDTHNGKFCLNAAKCTHEFWACLLQRMKEYSTWTVEEFRDQNNGLDRRHLIDFRETSEQNGFGTLDEENLGMEEAWQFSVKSAADCIWRVHGILQDDTFYVIWLDPCHRLFRKPFSC